MQPTALGRSSAPRLMPDVDMTSEVKRARQKKFLHISAFFFF
jgi:hypothetical protein